MRIKKNSVLTLFVSLSVLLSLQVAGCGPRVIYPPREEKEVVEVKPPAGLNMAITVEKWTIVGHRILDYNPKWGYFRFAGRFNYNGELVFKFKSDRYPDHYWLSKIPSVREGIYEIRARLYEEPSPWPTIEPPKRFSVILSIRNGKVSTHFIRDPHPGWGEFIFSRYKKGILYLRNSFYPGHEWAARMPKQDGKWTIYPTLITDD